MQTVISNAGVTQLYPLATDSADDTQQYHPQQHWRFCYQHQRTLLEQDQDNYSSNSYATTAASTTVWQRICCCCCCLDRHDSVHNSRRNSDATTTHGMPWGGLSNKQNSKATTDHHGFENRPSSGKVRGGLSKEVYEKIQEVDNQSSTLSSMPHGLSQRVLERYEFCKALPDGTQQWLICQQVELIKKPGQTLGLYIREGNGIDRNDGIFISRIAEGTDVEKHGILKVGDEIVSVNNVEVANIGIDDVVVIMSIPRRLILKTKFPKHPIGPGALQPLEHKRPIVVLKNVPRDESKESSLGADDAAIEQSTAETSLGAQARTIVQPPNHAAMPSALATPSSAANTPNLSERSRLLGDRSRTGDFSTLQQQLQSSSSAQSQVTRSFSSHQQGTRPLSGAFPFPSAGYASSSTVPQSQSYQAYPHLTASGRKHADASSGNIGSAPASSAQLSRQLQESYSMQAYLTKQLAAAREAVAREANLGHLATSSRYKTGAPSPLSPGRGLNVARRLPSFSPRILDSQGQLIGLEENTEQPQSTLIWENSTNPFTGACGQETQSQQQHSPYLGSGVFSESYNSPIFSPRSPRSASAFNPQSQRRSDGVIYSNMMDRTRFPPRVQRLIADDLSSDSDSGGATGRHPQKSSLRQPSRLTAMDSGAQRHDTFDVGGLPYSGSVGGLRSNSLPRRRVGRVKWRNDVIGGSRQGLADASQTSDSDGAISAPELPMSRPLSSSVGGSPRERYRSNVKTIEDIFTSAEYRAWNIHPDGRMPGIATVSSRGCSSSFQRASRSQQPFVDRFSRDYDYLRSPFPAPATVANQGPKHNSLEMLYACRGDEEKAFRRPPPLGAIADQFRQTQKRRSSSLPPRAILMDPASGRVDSYSRAEQEETHFPATHAQFSPLSSHRQLSQATTSASLGATPISNAFPLSQFSPRYAPDLPVYPNARAQSLVAQQQQQRQQQQMNVASSGLSLSEPETAASFSGFAGSDNEALLTGLLVIHLMEGRGLKIPDKTLSSTDELYCVVEVDGEHRARTSVTTLEQNLTWDESFEIDVMHVRQADFFVYSWHPEFRHKLCHRGSLQLLAAFFEATNDRRFALNLEPRGQLMIRVHFSDMEHLYRRRSPAVRRSGHFGCYFGTDLNTIVARENSGFELPIAFKRIVEEIERRGVDTIGLYQLCGCAEKKKEVRSRLEKEPMLADISVDNVPDINVLTGLIKDFLRELPEPLFPTCIYQMLLDAWLVCLPNDKEGNVRLMLSIIDCLPRENKCTLMLLMDHLKCVCSQSPHNTMNEPKLCGIIGPLVFCTSRPQPSSEANLKLVNSLDPRLAGKLLTFILELWPTRTSSSSSSTGSSDASAINLTNNGTTSLVDLWFAENQLSRQEFGSHQNAI